jgi:hypothetical protein
LSSTPQFRSRFSSAKSDAYKMHAMVRILFAPATNSQNTASYLRFRLLPE